MKNFKTRPAILLVNLGTPEQATPSAVRRFLKQFLSDPRVVEIPKPIWWMILNAFILPFRPKPVSEAYASIWTDRGSPLRWITEDQVEGLQKELDSRLGEDSPLVEYAMTYGAPAIADQLKALYANKHRRILVLPLYPQYSGSTTGAIYDQIADFMRSERALPGLNIVNSYFYEQSYIDALAQSIREHWQTHGRGDKLLFSYHGIPKRYVDNGDPYQGHCLCTTAAVADALGLDSSEYLTTFQSRFGKAEWLQPYTDKTVIELAQSGVETLDVICPAFAADCLETLEEITVENGEYFQEHGGKSLRLIPCLNASPTHISALADIVQKRLS